jgi:hypothetical protein
VMSIKALRHRSRSSNQPTLILVQRDHNGLSCILALSLSVVFQSFRKIKSILCCLNNAVFCVISTGECTTLSSFQHHNPDLNFASKGKLLHLYLTSEPSFIMLLTRYTNTRSVASYNRQRSKSRRLYHYTQHPPVTPTINSRTLLQKIQSFFQEMSIKLDHYFLLGDPDRFQSENSESTKYFPES